MSRASEVFSLLGKHQLIIHVDYGPAILGLEIRYSYPLSTLHVSPERVIRIPQDRILRDVLRHLDHLVRGLTVRIPPPSGPPWLDRGYRLVGATIAIQDNRHGHEVPFAWLTYEEDGREIGSRVGKEVRMTPRDFTPDEVSSWDRLRQRIKGIAWAHYQGAVGDMSP